MASKSHLIKQQLQTNYRQRQLYQSINKYLRLHILQRSEVKARADTRLLLTTSRMECIIARRIFNTTQICVKVCFHVKTGMGPKP